MIRNARCTTTSAPANALERGRRRGRRRGGTPSSSSRARPGRTGAGRCRRSARSAVGLQQRHQAEAERAGRAGDRDGEACHVGQPTRLTPRVARVRVRGRGESLRRRHLPGARGRLRPLHRPLQRRAGGGLLERRRRGRRAARARRRLRPGRADARARRRRWAPTTSPRSTRRRRSWRPAAPACPAPTSGSGRRRGAAVRGRRLRRRAVPAGRELHDRRAGGRARDAPRGAARRRGRIGGVGLRGRDGRCCGASGTPRWPSIPTRRRATRAG